jgi:hypothetical protein
MIKNIISTGPFVQVHGGSDYSPYVNMSNASAGMIRWNGNTSNFEVYDGSTWMSMSSTVATVGLNNDAVSAISWALKKMEEEQKLKQLMEKHPGLQDAHEKFEIMRILVTQENKEAQ